MPASKQCDAGSCSPMAWLGGLTNKGAAPVIGFGFHAYTHTGATHEPILIHARPPGFSRKDQSAPAPRKSRGRGIHRCQRQRLCGGGKRPHCGISISSARYRPRLACRTRSRDNRDRPSTAAEHGRTTTQSRSEGCSTSIDCGVALEQAHAARPHGNSTDAEGSSPASEALSQVRRHASKSSKWDMSGGLGLRRFTENVRAKVVGRDLASAQF